ncbi:polyprotein, partial [Elysia marginata]
MLRDRLVCGINDRRIQHRLLSEGTLTFSKALEIAQAMETAAGNVQDLLSSLTDQVCLVKSQSSLNSYKTAAQKKCHRCGGPHYHTGCKFKESKCYKCQKVGHIAKVCRSTSTKPQVKVEQHKTHNLDEQLKDDDEESFALFTVYLQSQPIYKELK